MSLDTYIERVEKILSDQSADIYSTQFVIEGIRIALGYYSRQKPFHADTTLTLTASSREIDVSSVTGLIDIRRVWVPYNVANPEYPPLYRQFEHWKDSQTIYVEDYSPADGNVLRLFYTSARTIDELDGATATNIDAEDVAILLEGASAFTIISEATHGVDQVQIDSPVSRSEQLMEIAKFKLARFYAWLGLDENGQPVSGLVEDGSSGKGVTIKRLFHTDFYQGSPTVPDWDK